MPPYSLTSVLVSRFLLRLQAANGASVHASSNADVTSIVFEHVVGAIGASIGPEDFATSESEGELWDEEDQTDLVPEEGAPEQGNLEEGNAEGNGTTE